MSQFLEGEKERGMTYDSEGRKKMAKKKNTHVAGCGIKWKNTVEAKTYQEWRRVLGTERRPAV
jgi:hypothetical protein